MVSDAGRTRELATRALTALMGEDVGVVVFVFDRGTKQGSYAATSEEDFDAVRKQLRKKEGRERERGR